MKINKKSKEGIKRKVALISLVALMLNAAMLGVFVPSTEIARAEPDQMCEAVVDVVLVMDRSGSMVYSLSQAKIAANSFLGNLGVNDQSALVSYATYATLDKGLSSNHTGSSPSTESYVNALYATGLTNIGEAISEGTAELLNSGRSQAVKTMILLTDGKANRPSGNAYNYAIDKAIEAAGHGYIIFTIGLGTNIDAVMLQEIANKTGGGYYAAPSASDLEAIYDEISTRLCLLGSISGCKYIDSDKDGNITGEQTEEGWEIILSGHASKSQETDVYGCYSFAGLLPGTYTVSEGGKTGEIFEQTYPLSPNSHTVNLDEGDNIIDIDFGNYIPFCGNSFIDTGYAGYTDEVCEIGDTQSCDAAGGYVGSQSCNSSCSGWGDCVPQEWCGDGIVNNGEDCDGQVGVPEHYFCTNQCTLEYVPYCGDNIVNQLSEECDGDCPKVCTTPNGYDGFQTCLGCLWGSCDTDESCGDGIINGPEQCDDGANNGAYGYCNLDCTGDTPSVCGNEIIEGDEECDDGQDGSETCTNECTFVRGSISGYKFNDANKNGVWDKTDPDNELGIVGWMIELYGSINGDIDPTHLIAEIINPATTNADGYYEFTNLSAGIYFVQEVLQSGWTNTTGNPVEVDLGIAEDETDVDFGNYEEPVPIYECSDGVDNDGDKLIDADDPGCHSDGDVNNSETYEPEDDDEYHPYCGDGTCNNNETCSTCSQDCGSCGGGGGVITRPSIIITNEKVVYLGEGEALVTWTTNIETTRQVVYGDESITVLGSVPEYGYDSVNEESTSMTKEHSVTISGLTDGMVYYFRPVADRSGSTGEKVGMEVSYKVGEVKGTETPTPAPVACNYLLEYIKLGADNNPVEVKKLETFLNEFENENLAVNGIYEQVDFDAVSRFQKKYLEDVLSPWSHNEATGYVYITTKKKINEIYCQSPFPLTAEQEAEVARFSARYMAPETVGGAPEEGVEISDDAVAPSEEPAEEPAEEPSEEEVGEAPQEEEGAVAGAEDEIVVGDEDDETVEGDDAVEDDKKTLSEMFESYGGWKSLLALIIIIGAVYYFAFYRRRKMEEGE